jgi:nicotinamidase-related amidase
VEEAPGTVKACQRVLEFARGNGLFVAFTQDTHRAGDPEFEIWGEHVLEGTWGWEIIPELRPREGEPVHRKARYDGFYGTQLDHDLRLQGIRDLVVVGTVANICVHYTAASAGLRWYGVILPVDCVSALTEFDKEASFRQASWLFQARLTTSAGLAVAR